MLVQLAVDESLFIVEHCPEFRAAVAQFRQQAVTEALCEIVPAIHGGRCAQVGHGKQQVEGAGAAPQRRLPEPDGLRALVRPSQLPSRGDGPDGQRGLTEWLLRPGLRLHEFIPPRAIADLLAAFYAAPLVDKRGYTVSMLLTFSAWLETYDVGGDAR